jgi:prefoldin subunit 5
MKSSQLRSPLIGAAIVLALFTLVVYFRLTTPDGSLAGSFGSIVILILKSIQIVIGLGLALLVSLAVLIAIFLGAVALNNPAAASRMYEGLRSKLASWLAPLAGMIRSDQGEKLEQELASLKGGLKNDMIRLVEPVKKELTVLQEAAEKKVTGLKNRLCEVEEGVAAKASGEDLETLSGEIAGLAETVQGIETTLKELAAKIEQAGKVDPAEILGDLPARMEALEQKEIPEPVDLQPVEEKIDGLAKTIAEATRPLNEKITSLDGEIATLKEALARQEQKKTPAAAKPARKAAAPAGKKSETPAAKKAEPKKGGTPKKSAAPKKEAAPAKGEDEHRLLSYFDDPADKKKLKNLVAQTLKKDMTYAQVTKYLVKEMGKQKGKIISEHPALAKDYIRQCRRRG